VLYLISPNRHTPDRTWHRRIGTLCGLALSSLALATPPAIAAATTHAPVAQTITSAKTPTSVPSTNQVELRINSLLQHNPGSHRISPNQIQVADGAVISVAAQPNDVQGCPTFWLCLSENSNFGGDQIRFEACRNENLGNYHMAGGRAWNDQISSIRNAQSSGIQSRFYNYDGSGDPNNSSNWRFVLPLNAGHYLRNLANDSSADGGNANDKIDIVHVC
jgi:hypothetical protein